MQRFGPPLLAVAFGLVASLLLAEVGLRLIGPALGGPRLPLSYDLTALDRIAAGEAYIAFDAELGWRPAPSTDRVGGDIHYRANAAGIRADRELTVEPGPGVRRVLAFGDSFTYCEEVDIADCWTSRLQELWPRSEILNYGVPGYAIDQALLRYRSEGARLQPCAVLIGHMVENINRVVNRFRPFYYPETGIPLAKPRFSFKGSNLTLLPNPASKIELLYDPAWVETNLGPLDRWYFPDTFQRSPLDQLALGTLTRTASYRAGRQGAADWTPGWAEQIQKPGGEAFEITIALLAEFAGEVRAAGMSPLVLIFPWKDEILAQRDGQPRVHAALLSALQDRGVPVLDLTDALGEQARRSSIGNLTVEHYRPLGNQVVARAVARELSRSAAPTCGS